MGLPKKISRINRYELGTFGTVMKAYWAKSKLSTKLYWNKTSGRGNNSWS